MASFYSVVDAAGYPLCKCAGVVEFADDRQFGDEWAIEYLDADEAEEDAARFGGTVETYSRPDKIVNRNKTILEAMALIDMMQRGAMVGVPAPIETYKKVKAKLSSIMEAHA